ncbi:ApaG domain-containing protein [Halobacteriovorax sp. JY17]|uniref:ApaG domain-containing protein n=1 Tax=Halobacteriovorax sp. JY17 TaxID=2014617 RepID=UPI000C597061|nr:ApaG domain-containing protein [Halobacteriovorax sp. JY17]PIK16624.1 MAG: hypothetical protein CES88_07735 [Halobacteriovorax sp. JY17]
MLELRKVHTLSVKVEPIYIPELSQPAKKDYVFNYTITISNGVESDIQILGKTLFFRDGKRKEVCIEYDEVNEEQAWVPAGDSYDYSEFHTMRTSTGNLRGSLLVRVIETNEELEVEVPLTFFRIFSNKEIISLQKVAR